MVGSDDYISVRDWRREPPLRLRVTKKLDIHRPWLNCTRCPRTRAVCSLHHPLGSGWRDMLRQDPRCGKCGRKGVTPQHPSSGGSDTGRAPMPVAT